MQKKLSSKRTKNLLLTPAFKNKKTNCISRLKWSQKLKNLGSKSVKLKVKLVKQGRLLMNRDS